MNILMTGCSRSVGEYIRRQLEIEGHNVFGIGQGGPHMVEDFSTTENHVRRIDKIMSNAHEWFWSCGSGSGAIHCLINNAGATHIDWLENQSILDMTEVMNINFWWPLLLTQRMAALERMADTDPRGADGFARIINISSYGTKAGLRASMGYACSKAALDMLTRNSAKEFTGRLPILVFGVAPCGVEGTAMQSQVIDGLVEKRGFKPEDAAEYFAGNGFHEGAQFSDIATVVRFLVVEAPKHMTGEIIGMPAGSGM